MQIYEEMPLEAKEITDKERRRLRRLKRKAEKQPEAVAVPVQEDTRATTIKIEGG